MNSGFIKDPFTDLKDPKNFILANRKFSIILNVFPWFLSLRFSTLILNKNSYISSTKIFGTFISTFNSLWSLIFIHLALVWEIIFFPFALMFKPNLKVKSENNLLDNFSLILNSLKLFFTWKPSETLVKSIFKLFKYKSSFPFKPCLHF